jgi:signal transduction histidine kinase
LTNITRYAKASHVIVKLEKSKDNIFFEVTDNGKGFNESELNNLNSFGILGMKERTLLIGGLFDIRSEPHSGTTIRVTIPTHSSTSMEQIE